MYVGINKYNFPSFLVNECILLYDYNLFKLFPIVEQFVFNISNNKQYLDEHSYSQTFVHLSYLLRINQQ